MLATPRASRRRPRFSQPAAKEASQQASRRRRAAHPLGGHVVRVLGHQLVRQGAQVAVEVLGLGGVYKGRRGGKQGRKAEGSMAGGWGERCAGRDRQYRLQRGLT